MVSAPVRSPGSSLTELRAGMPGWTCRLETDSRVGSEKLRAVFARVLLPEGPHPSSTLRVEGLETGTPVLRAFHGSDPIDLGAIAGGPEWKRLVPLMRADRQVFADASLGPEAALEIRDGGLEVLQPERWPLYAFLAFLWLMLREHPVFSLHAAVAAAGERALVLVGPSGSGKSTLAWALHTWGAEVFGDEWALFTEPALHLHPLERDLGLRPAGIGLLDTLPPARHWYEARPGDPKCALRLPASLRACPHEQLSLYFMDGFAARPCLRPLEGGEAVRRVVRCMGHGRAALGPRLRAAASLVNRYPCWALTAGGPEATAALLLVHGGGG